MDLFNDEIDHLRGREVCLKSGKCLQTDAILLGTGWRNSLDYMSPSLRASLGLPYLLTAELNRDEATAARRWFQREQDADVNITAAFPVLADPPTAHARSPVHESPFRLYNLVVSLDDDTRSFACIGQINTSSYFRTGEIQSLWVTAYFDGKLTLPPLEQRADDVAHFVAWNRKRYLRSGEEGNVVVFDTLRYTDRLLDEVGLESYHKGWLAHYLTPNRARDYAGLRDEYVQRFGRCMY
ncbi:MAG: hypothetical protein Q9162_006021 [Coniocarpon cinnabarinum]